MPTNCTIALSKETRQKLEEMKAHERETFDGLLNRIIDENFHLEKRLHKLRGKTRKLV